MKKNILFALMVVLVGASLALLIADSLKQTMWPLLVMIFLPAATTIWHKTDFTKDDSH